jgi:dienelactone hydrolase
MRRIPAAFILSLIVSCGLFAQGPFGRDASGPAGTWYLDANGARFTVVISPGATEDALTGTIADESGHAGTLDTFKWDRTSRQFSFRADIGNNSYWCRGSIVEGIFVGRYAQAGASGEMPAQAEEFKYHVTGWNSTYLDHGLAPRVYDVLINKEFHATLRIDVSEDSPSGFIGRLKVYGSVSAGARGEQVEFDVHVTQWDGTKLSFVENDPLYTMTFTGTAAGRLISGTYTQSNFAGTFPWQGARAQVLSYGFGEPKNPDDRTAWQNRVRRQLYALMMGGNPKPLAMKVTVLAADLPPLPSKKYGESRDDNPAAWPQNYRMSEIQIDSTLPNLYGGAPLARREHGYLAVPTTPPPVGGKYPAVIAVNGHGGSAWSMMNPDGTWYGDAFARRGFVVFALDISHRPLEDRQAPYMTKPLYADRLQGEDPAHGNGVHPAIKAAGFDSDWEEDGERVYDAMRALDYVLSLPNVDATRVLVTGHSMGGEISAIMGALEPRIRMSVVQGFSPDLGVVLMHGNHPCWTWMNADIREYVDASDYFALNAPHPLIVGTGRSDNAYSVFPEPFAEDLEVMRRVRVAYGGEVSNVLHYLDYDTHRYHVGDINPTLPEIPINLNVGPGGPRQPGSAPPSVDANVPEYGVRIPESIAPTGADPSDAIDWQTDGRTYPLRATLFDCITYYLQLAPARSAAQ